MVSTTISTGAYQSIGVDVVWLTYGPAQFLIVHTVTMAALTRQNGDLSSTTEVSLDVAG